MPSTGQKKQDYQRAYLKTPAGKQSRAKSQARWIEKRSEMRRELSGRPEMKINPQALIQALAQWR